MKLAFREHPGHPLVNVPLPVDLTSLVHETIVPGVGLPPHKSPPLPANPFQLLFQSLPGRLRQFPNLLQGNPPPLFPEPWQYVPNGPLEILLSFLFPVHLDLLAF